jgi:hypothetical protein
MTIQALNESGINIVGNKLQADEVKLMKYLDTQLAGDKEKIAQAMGQIKEYITMINSRNLPEKGLYNVMNQGGKNSLDQIIGTAKNWLQQRSALSTIQNLPTTPAQTPPNPTSIAQPTVSEPKGNTVTNIIGKGVFGDTMLAMNARSNR